MAESVDMLLERARVARREHRLDDARRELATAVETARAAGNQAELARALCDLGQIERDLEHLEIARGHYEEAIAIYRDLGDLKSVAHSLRHMADILREQGRAREAGMNANEALAIYRGDPTTAKLELANAIRVLALIKEQSGARESALTLWTEARRLYKDVGVEAGVQEGDRRIALLGKNFESK